MDQHKRHVTSLQKKRLLEFMTKHPNLIKGTSGQERTNEFSFLDAQRLWQHISRELNDIPGAKKTWRQWRKTWQDLRSKTKKQQASLNGALPLSVVMYSPAEQEALGIKNVESASTATIQETTEFVPLETDSSQVNNFHEELESVPSLSDPESPPETKPETNIVFSRPHKTKINNYSSPSRHTDTCALNCDLFAVHEQKKLQLKEDFINYKKDYLRKKLKLMKEQTEALKAIARELSER